MTGTPCEVPLPKTVTSMAYKNLRKNNNNRQKSLFLQIIFISRNRIKMFDRLRYRMINRAIGQFIAGKNSGRLPDFNKLTSIILIIEELDKEEVHAIEEHVKKVFGVTKTRFIIISEKASNDMLFSDQYCEVTTKDFGFMKVLKAEKQEELRKLPMTHLLVNLSRQHPDISDYLATLPNASFRVSFTKSRHFGIYDLIIDNGSESKPINDIDALNKYLKALTGN